MKKILTTSFFDIANYAINLFLFTKLNSSLRYWTYTMTKVIGSFTSLFVKI